MSVDEHNIAKDQGSPQNPWPHPRPDYMTETHHLVLKELYSEGLDTTGLIRELAALCKLEPHQARAIVCHWLASDKYGVK